MENKINAEDLVKNQEVNAGKWAAAFMQIFGSDLRRIDEGLMISWFANAIMVAHDKISNAKDAEIEQLKADLAIVHKTLEGQRSINDRQYDLHTKEIQQLKSKLEVAKKGLEFYIDNGNEVGIWDNERNTNDWGFRAQETLKEINEG